MTSYSRRTALRGAAVAVAGVAGMEVSRIATSRGRKSRAPVTFVEVTGASGTPGAISDLALRGHRTVGVTLPGHGIADGQFTLDYQAPQDLGSLATRQSPLRGIGLGDFAEAVIDVVRKVAVFGPVVLYGSSSGGAVLNRVSDVVPELIDHLVYDTAFCCVDLASPNDYYATPEGSTALIGNLAGISVGDPAVIGAMRTNYRTADPSVLADAKAALMAGASDAEFLAILAFLQPDETPALTSEDSRARAETWGRIPRTYIRHTADRMLPIALQDRMIAEADRLTPGNRFRRYTIDAPHMANRAQAERVIEILDGIAGQDGRW